MQAEIYTQNYLTFIITPERIVVKTPLQSFRLLPKTHYFNRRMKTIALMISLNEIRNLDELAAWCASGNIEWVPTSHSNVVYKPEVMV